MSDHQHPADSRALPAEPEPETVGAHTVDPVAERLHQPWRRYLALAELALVGVLAFGTWWLWHRGVVTTTLAMREGGDQPVDRYLGQWLLLALACATVGGVVLIDAVRQLALSWRGDHDRSG